jgi:hypothetical protein
VRVAALVGVAAPVVAAGGSLATPATVAALASVLAPTLSVGVTVSPVTVAAVAAVGSPTVGSFTIVAVAMVAALSDISAVDVTAESVPAARGIIMGVTRAAGSHDGSVGVSASHIGGN